MSNSGTQTVRDRSKGERTSRGTGASLAALIAVLASAAVVIDGAGSISSSLARGRSLISALFYFFHYFTILSNLAVAGLMASTLWRRERELPNPILYVCATIYVAVSGGTYEMLLRRLWSPRGLQFGTDITMHDVVPLLTLLFWLLFAPKQGLRGREALWTLPFPIVYFAMTLIAGALGAGYPYDFLDVSRLGYPAVLAIAAIFLTTFFTLGITMIGVARGLVRSPTAAEMTSEPD